MICDLSQKRGGYQEDPVVIYTSDITNNNFLLLGYLVT